MAATEQVRQHYAGKDLSARLLAAAGAGDGPVTVDALSPYDQLHAGGAAATSALLDLLGLAPGVSLLDVGCGLGGPARLAASRHGCHVTGVDLSPDFVDAARELTARAGLAGLVTFALGDGDRLPCDDASHDRAMLVHVGMNVPDKAALFAEVHRVVRPGGPFGLYEQMRVGPGDLPFPMPWAVDAATSFVETPDAYTDALTTAGFDVLRIDDRRAALAAAGGPGQDGLVVVFGQEFVTRISNNVAATRTGLLAPVVVLARA
ncbi:SAM-dependent methyltransferase [Cellulosimicrobium sp. NPDC057862]|uniref:SAM-dependent methyltransferase n=1 Tax=Cellulosimicrobium sp. NPDC057862 TaxID=3346266 RepID=UPI00366E3190